MDGAKQTVTIDEKITKAQEAVEKAKDKYDAAVKKLKNLMDKKEALSKKEQSKTFKNNDEKYDEMILFLMSEMRRKDTELEESYKVLNEMMDNFEGWFPIDETDTEEDIEDYKNRFASTKLCLELGEYTRDDYEYLFWVSNKVVNTEHYYNAINVFIIALSKEYGWV